jgi:nicotinamidase-related amidase
MRHRMTSHALELQTRSAASSEMAPRMNSVIVTMREAGSLIIHAPGGCMDFYAGTPGRARATQAPATHAIAPIVWNGWNQDKDARLPMTLTDPGPCSCESAEQCGNGEPPYPWTRQTPLIDITPDDAVSDDGQEILNLLEHRQIADVIVMGAHTNICVLGRPYGIRQLVYFGKSTVLCRDLTDSFHRDPRGHFWGTEQIVGHIERRWCPTVTSDQLVGGTPFRFREDRPRVVGSSLSA